MTHNRCIFLHCFSCTACGLGLGAREVLDKKAKEWAKEKWPKSSHARKLTVRLLCQNKRQRSIWLLVPESVSMYVSMWNGIKAFMLKGAGPVTSSCHRAPFDIYFLSVSISNCKCHLLTPLTTCKSLVTRIVSLPLFWITVHACPRCYITRSDCAADCMNQTELCGLGEMLWLLYILCQMDLRDNSVQDFHR